MNFSTKTTLEPNKLYYAFKQETTQTVFRDWKNKEHFWLISWDCCYFMSKLDRRCRKTKQNCKQTQTRSHEHRSKILTVNLK